MAETLRTEYQVVLTRMGDGAIEAQTQLETLQQTVQQNSAQLQAFSGTGKSTSLVLKSLGSVAQLAGLQHFPQLTMAAVLAKRSLDGIRASGVQLQANLMTVGAGVAGVAALVYSAVEAWRAYAAEQDEIASKALLDASLKQSADSLRERVTVLRQTGEITIETYDRLWRMLRGSGNLQGVRDFLKTSGQETADQAIARAKRAEELQASLAAITNDKTLAELKDQLTDKLAKELQLYMELHRAGQLTNKETAAYNVEATTRANQSLVALNKQLTTETIAALQRKQHREDLLDELDCGFTLEQQEDRLIEKKREFIALYEQLAQTGRISWEELVKSEEEAENAALQGMVALEQAAQKQKATMTDMQSLGVEIKQLFARDLSTAMVQAFTEGGQAFQKMAAQFLAKVGQMILEMQILRMMEFFGLQGGGMVFAASGGFFPRFAAAGIQTVSSPTYFPKFNVVAGESGREMLTVLARPRFMDLGGMEAVVGQAAGQRLAIANAEQLAARGGAGGSVQIHVSMEPGLRADIVGSSIQGAVVKVTQEMGRDTRLSRVTKQVMR